LKKGTKKHLSSKRAGAFFEKENILRFPFAMIMLKKA